MFKKHTLYYMQYRYILPILCYIYNILHLSCIEHVFSVSQIYISFTYIIFHLSAKLCMYLLKITDNMYEYILVCILYILHRIYHT